MGRKGESIFKRKDGRYEARYIKYYQENGKAKYGYVYGTSYNEVKRKRNLAMQTNKDSKTNSNYQDISFNEAINKWLEKQKICVKQATYSLYIQLIEKHIRNELGHYKISNINKDILNNYLINKLQKGRIDKKGGLSTKTVADMISIIKQILKYNGIAISTMTIKNSHSNIQIFTKNEINIIKEKTLDSSDRLAFGILLCLYTGMRIGEICALKNSDINIETETIKIDKKIIRIKDLENTTQAKTKLIIDTPKTVNSTRIIPVPNMLFSKLKRFINKSNDNYFLTNSKKLIEPRCYSNKYREYLEKWNISYKNFHSLRHTFATMSIENGFDVKSLSEILGHSCVNITLNLYVHPTIEDKRKYMNLLFH